MDGIKGVQILSGLKKTHEDSKQKPTIRAGGALSAIEGRLCWETLLVTKDVKMVYMRNSR
jgi:hypothetical protein